MASASRHTHGTTDDWMRPPGGGSAKGAPVWTAPGAHVTHSAARRRNAAMSATPLTEQDLAAFERRAAEAEARLEALEGAHPLSPAPTRACSHARGVRDAAVAVADLRATRYLPACACHQAVEAPLSVAKSRTS